MRPIKLVMENFGAFSGRVELDFSKLEDIFLITGKTGSGKTTIFDALCFALYGKVPGSRGEHLSRLRSDHAPEGSECFVSLEFLLGEKRYLAERCPKQERVKKRGGGTTSMEETLTLYEIINGEKTNPVSKKSEGDAKLKSLIGLEAEEFFKIVLLPQGEFAEFLRENTNERQKVLGKLFPVEKAVKVKELARKKAGDAEAEAKGAARVLDDISRRFNIDTYENERGGMDAEVEKVSAKCSSLEKEEALLVRVLGLMRNEKDAGTRLSESLASLEENANNEAAVNKNIFNLSRSRAARPLEQFLIAVESAELAAAKTRTEFAAAETEKKLAEESAAEAEEANLKSPLIEKEAHALREKRPALAEMLAEEKRLKEEESELEEQEAFIRKTENETALFSANLEAEIKLTEEAETLASMQAALEEEYELSKSIKNVFLDFRKYRERMDDLEKERAVTEREIKTLEATGHETEKRVLVLEAEIKELRDKKKRSEYADMAAHLSVLLEDGRPCPVCGSTEHPDKAGGSESPFDFDERIKAQEASLKEAEKNITSVNTDIAAKKSAGLKNREALSFLEKEISEEKQSAFPAVPENYPLNREALSFLEKDAPLPTREAIDRVIRLEAENLNGILSRLKSSRDAAGRLKDLYRKRAAIQNEKGEAEKKLAASREHKKNLASRIETSRTKHSAILNSAALSDPALREAAGGELSAGGILAALDSLIAEKEEIAAALKNKREKAIVRLSGARAAWEAIFRNSTESASKLEEARVSLEKALLLTDFSGTEEARNALIDPGGEEALENEIRLWREDRAGLDTKIAEQKKQLEIVRGEIAKVIQAGKEKTPANIKEAEERLAALKAERAGSEDEKKLAFAKLTGLEKDREAFLEAQKRHDTLAAKARELRILSDDLSGRNPRKLPFDSWLLGNYLDEAAAYATARLEKMSESRYSLLLDTERRQGRGYAGLELQVFDAHTGKTRPCATLSGGESFMASISLALGLADSIQNRSGGVRLDAVFIDEGFGSLDETSLDKALVILDELRDSRMVGLISHVGELRSRIPCRVELIKTSAGSEISVPYQACSENPIR